MVQWATEEVVSTGLQLGVASYVMGTYVKIPSIDGLNSHSNTHHSEAHHAHQRNMVPDSNGRG